MNGQKIRVAQVITRLDWGGSPDIFRILCSRLDPNLFDITIITGTTANPSQKTQEFLNRFRASTITVPSLRRNISPVFDITALGRLYSIFRRERFDIVHTHTAKAGALGRAAAALARTPVIIHTPHGHNFYGYFGPGATAWVVRTETFLARFTDEIVALTELEKSDYIRAGAAGAGQVSVIHQGLELDEATRDWKHLSDLRRLFRIGPEDQVVGMASRLEPIKGSGLFIEAAARIAAQCPRARFVIVGEGSLRPQMEKRAAELGISAKTVFTGWRDDAQDIISLMNVMVLPSLNEAVGMVLLEAQTEGVPVVASNVGGIPEVVENNRTGILVPPSDVEAIARAVTGLLNDRERRAAMGAAGRALVRGRFRADEMAHKTTDLYMRLLDKKRYEMARV